jgi:hypothetical protein
MKARWLVVHSFLSHKSIKHQKAGLTLCGHMRKDWRRGRDSNPRYGSPYTCFREAMAEQPHAALSFLSFAMAQTADVNHMDEAII